MSTTSSSRHYQQPSASVLFFALLVLHQHVQGSNLDQFNYRGTVGNDFGPEDWNQVTCDDLDECLGWPDGWELGNGWELEENQCRWCPAEDPSICGEKHWQSPINLRREVAFKDDEEHTECFDAHWMAYEDGGCDWWDMINNPWAPNRNAFQIRRHSLQIVQPVDPDTGLLQCQSKGRKFPRLDFPFGFPDWWHLSHTEITTPSEHTVNGTHFDAEVHLDHFYEFDDTEKLDKDLGKIVVFLQGVEGVERWPYLDKLLCQWREVEDQVREECGLPYEAPDYPGCRNGDVPSPTPPPKAPFSDPYPWIDCQDVDDYKRICKPTSCCEEEANLDPYCQGIYSKYEDTIGSICWHCCPGKLVHEDYAPPTPPTPPPTALPTVSPAPTGPPVAPVAPPPSGHFSCDSHPEINFDRMCDEACVEPRCATTGCHEFYKALGDEVDNACYHCCDQPKAVAPAPPIHPEIDPYDCTQIAVLTNTSAYRMCKDTSCCNPTRNDNDYCSGVYDIFGDDMAAVCWYCCEEPKLMEGAPPYGPWESPSVSTSPSVAPSLAPSISLEPSTGPSRVPSVGPSMIPSDSPSSVPTESESLEPSTGPSSLPSGAPSTVPSVAPSAVGTTSAPSNTPSQSGSPTGAPTRTSSPTLITSAPSTSASPSESVVPSSTPTHDDTSSPTTAPFSCGDYPGTNYNRMCDVACVKPRCASNECHAFYHQFGDDIDIACDQCCPDGEPKEVGPTAPIHPEIPEFDCTRIADETTTSPFRMCKETSCCNPDKNWNQYCTEQVYNVLSDEDLYGACWYCCSEPKLAEGAPEYYDVADAPSTGPSPGPSNNATRRRLRGSNSAKDNDTTQQSDETPTIVTLISGTGETDDGLDTAAVEKYEATDPTRYLHKIKLTEEDRRPNISEENFRAELDEYQHRRTRESETGHRRLTNYDDIPWSEYEWLREVNTEYYFRYEGNQIVPPCYIRAHYRVMKDYIPVHPDQIRELERLLAHRVAPKGSPINECQRDTAGKERPLRNGEAVDLNRPIQSPSVYHKTQFCECNDWDSKLESDQQWCDLPLAERLLEKPFNFDV